MNKWTTKSSAKSRASAKSRVTAALALAATSAVAELLLAAAAGHAGAAELASQDTGKPPVAKASKQETAGVVTGLAVGAAAGGPIGAMVGAAAGAWIGDRYHRKEEERHALAASFDTTVVFRTGDAQLRADAAEQLHKMGALLATLPDTRVRVAGFTDARGSEELNLELSKRRAMAVAAALESAGVAADRLIIEAHGKTLAMADPADLDGDAFERRVTITLDSTVPKLARAE